MKLKSCHTTLLTVVVFTLLMPLCALAQEDKAGFDPENHKEIAKQQDQESSSGSENLETRPSKNIITTVAQEPAFVRDAEIKSAKAVVKAVEKAPKEEEKVKKEEEDPLSFNFLYYIIEKFKISDIVE